MRIVCPNCAAIYEVPASRMTQPRMVRCARCGGKWMAPAQAEEAAQTPAATDPQVEDDADYDQQPADPPALITAMDRLAAAPPPQPRPTGLAAGWIATGIVLIVAVAATLTWRQQVVRAWPASARLLGSFIQVTSAPPPHSNEGSGPARASKQ